MNRRSHMLRVRGDRGRPATPRVGGMGGSAMAGDVLADTAGVFAQVAVMLAVGGRSVADTRSCDNVEHGDDLAPG